MKVEEIKYMIMARDMARAVKFYKDVIGLSVRFDSPHWTELRGNGATVALHGGWDGNRNKTGLSFQVSDIELACEEARSAGAEIVSGPVERPGESIKLADLVDTEGNEIMFTEYMEKR